MNQTIAVVSKNCTGCGLCASVCPKNAITMVADDKEGFLYPQINESACISCGICHKKCPVIKAEQEHKVNQPICVYASASKEEKVRHDSASGGVMTTLAQWIVDHGGIVVGASYSDDFMSVHHIIIDSVDDLSKIQGSKYVQSEINSKIYKQVKEDADKGRWVLFTGTHCQTAALHSYLNGKEYDKLIIADILCHGVPSPMAWKKYLSAKKREFGNKKIIGLNMKEKSTSWMRSSMKMEFENKIYCVEQDHWKMAFAADLMLRESCHNCKFKRGSGYSVSDITVGDFWGGEQYDIAPKGQGLSFTMINTDKGKLLWDKVSPSMNTEMVTYEDVLKGNPMLEQSAPRNGNRDRVFSILCKYPFSYMMEIIFAHKSLFQCHFEAIKREIKRCCKK